MFGINFNLEKCMFLVYSWGILGYIVSNEGKLLYPNKIWAIKDMPPQKNPRHLSVEWSGVVLPMLHQESYIHNGTNHKTHVWSENIWMDAWMLNQMEDNKKLVCGCTNFDCTSLGFWIPCYIEASNFVEGTLLTQTLRINIINWSFFNFSTMSNKTNNYWMLNIGYCVCLAQNLTLFTRKLFCFLFVPFYVSLSTQKLQILE
jgi:hypothetical protein